MGAPFADVLQMGEVSEKVDIGDLNGNGGRVYAGNVGAVVVFRVVQTAGERVGLTYDDGSDKVP